MLQQSREYYVQLTYISDSFLKVVNCKNKEKSVHGYCNVVAWGTFIEKFFIHIPVTSQGYPLGKPLAIL